MAKPIGECRMIYGSVTIVLVLLCVNFASVSNMARCRKRLCGNLEGVSDLEHKCTFYPIGPRILAHEYILRGRCATVQAATCQSPLVLLADVTQVGFPSNHLQQNMDTHKDFTQTTYTH